MVLVARRIYAFQESEPDSRPPPVSFSPPKAPPISAPLGPGLTLARPQSGAAGGRDRAAGESNRSAERKLSVKIALDRPCGTALWAAMAASRESTSNRYRIGAKVS